LEAETRHAARAFFAAPGPRSLLLDLEGGFLDE
jgi:hypothetical protein